jgi:hypothetical protein
MEIAAKKIEEMEKSLRGARGQRRQPGNLRHKLADILVIAFAALLCGLKDYEDMENLGREKEGWFRTFLELPNGIPDKNTFQRIFTMKSLQSRLWEAKAEGKTVNIDGKTIRGSADGEEHAARHVASAWIGENRLSLGQVKTEEKSNEITAVPELLDLAGIKGSTVTIDAADCNPRGARRR